MSNIGPPNWWLRDKMIELTDKTLNVIDNAEKRLNTRIDNISGTQYITNNTYNNMTDIIDIGTTNSLKANIVSTNSLRAKTERYTVNVTSASGDNHSVYSISVNKNQPNKLTVSFQQNINGLFVNSNTGLNDIFTGSISFTNSSNIINKYSLHISQTGIIPIIPEQNLDNILTNIGDINSSIINSWENTQGGFYIFTLDKDIVNVNDIYFNNTNNSSTIIFNGTLVFTELVSSFPLVIGNTDEKNIEIKALHTKLKGNLLSIENNFTNITGNTITIKNVNTDIISNNTNIQGNSINIGTNITTTDLIVGNQDKIVQMYKVKNGVSFTDQIYTNNITIDSVYIELSWKKFSETDILQGRIHDNNKIQLIYLNNNGIISYKNARNILHNKLKSYIYSKYLYIGYDYIVQNLFSLDQEENIANLNKFAINITDTANGYNYQQANITSVKFISSGNSGIIVELELDNNITTGYTGSYSLPFEMSLLFSIQRTERTLYINSLDAKFKLTASEGIFNVGNLTINSIAVAFGENTQALGKNSISSGKNTAITGNNSFSCGYETKTNGDNSINSGFKNHENNGENNIVSGNSNEFTGKNSIISGSDNNLLNVENSFISGKDNTTSGNISNSIISGNTNVSNNISNNIISGSINTVEGNNNFSSGNNNLVKGNDNFSSGSNNMVTGDRSIISGYDNKIISGYDNIISGYGNMITGNNSTISGSTNMVTGDNNIISGYGNSLNNTNSSAVIGIGLHAVSYNSLTIGMYNDLTNSEVGAILFDVGYGSYNDRKSIMRIFDNNIVKIKGENYSTSDRNMKSKITDISGNIAYQIIKNIDIKHFYKHNGFFKTDSVGNLINPLGPDRIGFIAQDVLKQIKCIDSNLDYDFIHKPTQRTIANIDTVKFMPDISVEFLTNDSLSANTLFIPNSSIADTSFVITKINGDKLHNGNITGNQYVYDISSVNIDNYENINEASLLSLTISAFQELSRKVDNILGNLKTGDPLLY